MWGKESLNQYVSDGQNQLSAQTLKKIFYFLDII
jgi:hypothetical protein